MRKFKFSGLMTVSCWTEVEAETEREATEIALVRDVAGLCSNPFDSEPDENWHFSNDGAAYNVTLDDEE